MTASNLSAVLHGAKDLRLEDHPVLEPKAGEAQVKVRRCGMCMTDVHQRDVGGLGELTGGEPVVLGHEFCGVVTQLGSDVTNISLGDRVAVDPVVRCGFCRECTMGRSNMCAKQTYVGFPGFGRGGMARMTTLPARCLHRIPDSIDFEEAALMEPLAVCTSAVNRFDVKVGDDVIVTGAGPIGLLTMQVVLARGACRVCVADTNEDRLKLARELGATLTVLFREDETDAQANAHRMADTLGNKADVAIECSGAALCMRTIVYAVKPGGVVGIVGLGPEDVTLPILHATMHEIDIRGSIANNQCFPAAIKLVASGKVKVKPIISHRARLEDLHKSMELVGHHKVMKIVIDCSGDNQ